QASPKSYGLRFALAGLLRLQGKGEEAAAEYSKLIQEDATGTSGLRGRDELADLRLAEGKTEEASRLIAEVLKINARDNQALLLRSRLALGKGDAVSAIADLRAVLKDQPNSLDVLTRLAGAHLSNNEPKLAVEVAGRAAELYPDNPAAKLLVAET